MVLALADRACLEEGVRGERRRTNVRTHPGVWAFTGLHHDLSPNSFKIGLTPPPDMNTFGGPRGRWSATAPACHHIRATTRVRMKWGWELGAIAPVCE